MTPQRWLSSVELAERYDISLSTVRHWRLRGSGPTGHKFGRHIRYQLADVEAWEAAQKFRIEGVPNQPRVGTSMRSFRSDDDLWMAAKAKADAEGRSMTDVLTAGLRDYLGLPTVAKVLAERERG